MATVPTDSIHLLARALLGSLGIADEAWHLEQVSLDAEQGSIELFVSPGRPVLHRCHRCGEPAGTYDSRPRSWRHTDVWGYATTLRAQVPRVRCAVHGVQQIDLPWTRRGSRRTRGREAEILYWLRGASVRRVARRFDLPWALAARLRDDPPE
ncbi:MAG: transposase family protein [Candidatus Eisenbacteria bacterium]|nr:transposase family protein [Candidatus Eisenbacteria bacterium]